MTNEELKKACDEHYQKWLTTPTDARDCFSAGWLDCLDFLAARNGLTFEFEKEVEEIEGE